MNITKQIYIILYICICVFVYAALLWTANLAFGEFSEFTTKVIDAVTIGVLGVNGVLLFLLACSLIAETIVAIVFCMWDGLAYIAKCTASAFHKTAEAFHD